MNMSVEAFERMLESAWDTPLVDYVFVPGPAYKAIRRAMHYHGVPRRRGARRRKFALAWEAWPR